MGKGKAERALAEVLPRILVTGANGFIGCNLVCAAQDVGIDVVALDRPGTGDLAERTRASLGGKPLHVEEWDALECGRLADALSRKRCAAIFHLAGSTDRRRTASAWTAAARDTVLPLAELTAAISELPATERPVVIVPGSQMEYGQAAMPWTEDKVCMPNTPYGVGKLAATMFCQSAVRTGMTRAVVLRLATVFGPGQKPTMLIPEVILGLLTGRAVPMSSGVQIRRFVFVRDVCAAMLHIALCLGRGDDMPTVLNAPACAPVSVAQVADCCLQASGRQSGLCLGALPLREDEVKTAWPDSSLAETLGLAAVAQLEEAVKDTFAWYAHNLWFAESLGYSAEHPAADRPSEVVKRPCEEG